MAFVFGYGLEIATVRRVVCLLEIIRSIATPMVSSRRRDRRLDHVLGLANSCEKIKRESTCQRDLL